MEKKITYRFLNTQEGQDKAHALHKQLTEQNLNPTFTMGVKWIIVSTGFVEQGE